MVKIFKLINYKNARLCFKYSLVFFLLVFFVACKRGAGKLAIVYVNQFPSAIQISKSLIEGDINELKVVSESNANKKAILGTFVDNDSVILFKPLIPLTFGFNYLIYNKVQLIGKVVVPAVVNDAPKLVKVYPDVDTIPENLLKIYLEFSKRMRTGEALNYIALLDKKGDTMQNVFLNLQPELWDTSGKVLTIWLDPGRIKRDLVLNQKLGNPLKKAQAYQLVISQQWKDNQGLKLTSTHKKEFTAGSRDSQIPNIDDWKIGIPLINTKSPLAIDTKEYLDHYLLLESIEILNNNGEIVNGKVKLSNDHLWEFIPAKTWKTGNYQIKVDARLEDLAANNLNRVFDRDIRKDKQQNKTFVYRTFEVRL